MCRASKMACVHRHDKTASLIRAYSEKLKRQNSPYPRTKTVCSSKRANGYSLATKKRHGQTPGHAQGGIAAQGAYFLPGRYREKVPK